MNRIYSSNTLKDLARKKGDDFIPECRRIETAVFNGIHLLEVARDFDVSPPAIFQAMVYLDTLDSDGEA